MEITPELAKRIKRQPAPNEDPQVDDRTSFVLLAEATELARRGYYADSETVIRQALCNPSGIRPTLWDLLARVYAQQGRYMDAETCWLKALEFSPGTPEYSEGLRAIARERRRSPFGSAMKWLMAVLLFTLAGYCGMAAYEQVKNLSRGPSSKAPSNPPHESSQKR